MHVKALSVLHEEFKRSWKLTKSELVIILADKLKEDKVNYEFEEDDTNEDKTYLGFSYMLLRKLHKSGWIEYEYGEDDFEDHIIIPDYAVMILETFEKIANQDIREYNKYVYLTFSALKTADEMKFDYYRALTNAYSQSRELQMMLRTLYGSIRKYHKMLSNHSDVKGLVSQHFDEFKPEIIDKIYSPLKTIDSVTRYKGHIIEILSRWIHDENIKAMIMTEAKKSKRDTDDSEVYIESMIEDTIYIYETVEEMLGLIDRKNAAYTKATVERVEYMINGDESVNGKLASLLHLIGAGANDVLIDKMKFSNITHESIKLKNETKNRVESQKVKMAKKPSQNDITKELGALAKEVNKGYTTKQINSYIKSRMANKDDFNISELDGIEEEDFVKLILACVHHDDKNSSFDIKLGEGTVKKDNYILPNISYIRRR